MRKHQLIWSKRKHRVSENNDSRSVTTPWRIPESHGVFRPNSKANKRILTLFVLSSLFSVFYFSLPFFFTFFRSPLDSNRQTANLWECSRYARTSSSTNREREAWLVPRALLYTVVTRESTSSRRALSKHYDKWRVREPIRDLRCLTRANFNGLVTRTPSYVLHHRLSDSRDFSGGKSFCYFASVWRRFESAWKRFYFATHWSICTMYFFKYGKHF